MLKQKELASLAFQNSHFKRARIKFNDIHILPAALKAPTTFAIFDVKCFTVTTKFTLLKNMAKFLISNFVSSLVYSMF